MTIERERESGGVPKLERWLKARCGREIQRASQLGILAQRERESDFN